MQRDGSSAKDSLNVSTSVNVTGVADAALGIAINAIAATVTARDDLVARMTLSSFDRTPVVR